MAAGQVFLSWASQPPLISLLTNCLIRYNIINNGTKGPAIAGSGDIAMMIQTYLVYALASFALTVWVGRTLNKNGRLFLVENFHGNEALADSVNHLLLVGFYLVNFGFIFLALKYGDKPATVEEAIEFLSTKIGLVIVVLGVMHFFLMHQLIRFRNIRFFQNNDEKTAVPPV